MDAEYRDVEGTGAELVGRVQKMAGQIGNWIIAANAAGLAFILATARDVGVESALPLREAYVGFLWGLGMALAAHAFGLVAMLGAAIDVTRQAFAAGRLKELKDRRDVIVSHGDTPSAKIEAAIEHNTLVARRMLGKGPTILLLISGALYVAAGYQAAAGLAFPLLHNAM